MRGVAIALILLAGCSDVVDATGEIGDRGPTGPAGPRGPRGMTGQLGAVRVVSSTADVQLMTMGVLEVTCNGYEHLVGGGCEWGKAGELAPVASRPVADEEGEVIAWRCTGFAPEVPTTIEAFALCAE